MWTSLQKLLKLVPFWKKRVFDYGVLIGKMQLVKLDDKIYQKNEFLFLFSTEQQEAENLGYDVAKT